MDKEQMFETIMKSILDSYEDEPLLEGNISKSYLSHLTDVDLEQLDECDILAKNEELTKSHGHVAQMYGFDNFYDLYLLAKATDEYEEVAKAGQKEFSRLKKVKRTVIRNGRPTTMTFYEDPSKGGEPDKGNSQDGEQPEQQEPPQVRNASELPSTVVGDFQGKVPVRDLKLLRKLHASLGTSEEFDADCDQYSLLTDEEGVIRGMIGLAVKDGYVQLVFHEHDAYTKAMQTRAFFTLIKTALTLKLGARLAYDENDKLYTTLAENYGFEQEGNVYQEEYDDLVKVFGEI